jgi:PAS domain S-box-containing protein
MNDHPTTSSHSPTPAAFIFRLTVGVLLINLFIFTLKGYSLRESWRQYEERAEVTTQNLSWVLQQTIGGSIDKVDVALSATADEIERQIANGGINALALNSFMARQKSRLPELDGLRMADAKGDIAYNSDPANGAQRNVADRDYFRRLREDAKAGLIISSPLVSRVTGKWSLILARRVTNPAGTFSGVVYGVIPLEHFHRLFSSIDVGKHGSITLRDAAMGIVARYPRPREDGNSVGSKEVSKTFRDLIQVKPDSATYKAVYPIDKIKRKYTYRRISPYPLYINVGMAESDYLAEWRGEVKRMLLFAALFFAVTLGAAFIVYRSWKRKRASVEELRRQFLFLQQLLDAIPIPVYYKDTSGVYLGCNTAFQSFTGQPKSQIVGKDMHGLIPRDHIEAFQRLDTALLADGGAQTHECRINNEDGTFRDMLFNKATYKDADGRIAGIVGAIMDVTQRKKDEKTLCRINRTLRTLMRCNEVLVRAERESNLLQAVCEVITMDSGYRLAWIGYAENDERKSIRPVAQAGFEEGFLEGLNLTWADEEKGRGPSGIAIRTGTPCLMKDILNDPRFKPWRAEAEKRGCRSLLAIPLVSPEGTFGSLSIYASETDAFDAEEQDLMVRLANDLVFGITALRTRETQRRTAQALGESLEQYQKLAGDRSREHSLLRALLDSIPDLIFFKDSESVYLGCNKAFEAFCGRTEKMLVGCSDLDLFPREVAEFFRDMDRKMMALNMPRRNEEWIDYPDGRRALLDTLKTPFYDQNGILLGMIGISRDITEKRQTEEERKHLEAQLQQAQKMEAVGQLAGGIAHDFNNILTAIIGYSEVILLRMDENSPFRHHMKQVLNSAERAAELTKGLLAFSRKQVLDTRLIDLCEVVRGMEVMLSRIIPEDIDFRTTVSQKILTVMADKGQIEQVLMNLVTNAKDSMPKGGALSVDVSPVFMDESFAHTHGFADAGNYACISVSDTGHGMDRETQRKIFEPFFTTKEVGKGTGLGMAIIYGIIKQHNGYINVYSERGSGTTFRIYLPLSSGEIENFEKPIYSVSHDVGRETILLVEDDVSVRELHRMILEEAGYTIIEAVDGEDAMDKFKENQSAVDMLVTDVIMPKIDGKSLYQEIEKVRPDMKVLFTSGYTRDIIIKRGILDDELNFLSKPVTASELLRKVRHTLDRNMS